MKKYELTGDTRTTDEGTTLHRIRATRNFDLVDGTEVRKGDIGGWIESEENLSQYGNAWVYDNACVYDKAYVFGNARVYGDACVYDKARVYGDAYVFGDARVYDNARVYDKARVSGDARVYDNACVYDKARVYGDAYVFGDARVYDNARVSGDARVESSADYTVFKNTWSSFRWFTYTRSNGMWNVGCFHGTGAELIAKAYKDSELSGRCYEAIVRAQEAIDAARKEAKE